MSILRISVGLCALIVGLFGVPSALGQATDDEGQASVRPSERVVDTVGMAATDINGYPLFRNYTPDDFGKRIQTRNWEVTQDSRGLIYVANPGGVLVNDGASWRLLPTEKETSVRTVVSGDDGTVYVGAYNEIGKLAPDSTGTLQYVSLLDEVKPALRDFGHIWSSAAGPDGIYFQSRELMLRWNGERIDHWSTPDTARFFRTFALNNEVYVMQEANGLRRITGGQLEIVPGTERFAEEGVTTVLPYKGGRLLVGTSASELYLQADSTFERFPVEADAFLKKSELYDAKILPDGSYAFATLWGGVLIIDDQGRTLRMLDSRAGLVDDDVKSLYVDQQDGLWMACESGLSRAEVLSPISIYDQRTSLDGIGLTVERHDGDLYAGTTSGVYRLTNRTMPDGTVRPTFRLASNVRAQVFSLLSTGRGILTATDKGVFLIRNGRTWAIGENRQAFSLHRSQADTSLVYVGYMDGIGTLRLTNSGWSTGASLSGLNKGIYSLGEDAAGHLWAASAYSGLWRIDPADGFRGEAMIREVASEGEMPRHVFRMARLANGELRIVMRDHIARPHTDEIGAITLRPDSSIMSYLPETAEPRRILNLEAAPDGDLWVFTGEQVYWLERRPDEGYEVSTPFAAVEDFGTYTMMAEAGGVLWQAGEGGIARHKPGTYQTPPPTINTLIRRVATAERDSVIFGGTWPEDELQAVRGGVADAPAPEVQPASAQAANAEAPDVVEAADPLTAPAEAEEAAADQPQVKTLAYDHNALRFEFAAPGYGHESSIEYQHMLAGFDEAWSEWTQEAKKDYTNLPPGRYEFKVRSRNPHMWTGSTAAYAFTIMPPWYRTTWAYMLYIVMGAAVVTALVRWRSSHLEARAQQLERIVAKRTSEVKDQAEQLEMYNSELQRANEVLQEALNQKSELLGVAAHDLKNPLFGIRALSEVLLQKHALEDKVEHRVTLIRESADETLGLINDLLASAASSAHSSLDAELLDMVELAEWVVHSFRPQAERKQQTLEISIVDEGCVVEADKRKLREAMNNLVSNAIKYSPYEAPVEVTVERIRDEVHFVVHDEGPGLDEEDQEKLFTPFQRLTPEPTGNEGSSGLGLYIVKQIAELHGGRVWVESEKGHGSAFAVVIPAADAKPSPEADQPGVADEPAGVSVEGEGDGYDESIDAEALPGARQDESASSAAAHKASLGNNAPVNGNHTPVPPDLDRPAADQVGDPSYSDGEEETPKAV